jgi:hypothetical protein
MIRYMSEALATIRRPNAIAPDPIHGRWRYWRADIGPTRWLFVVVDWLRIEPMVVTAYGQPKVRLPREAHGTA